MASEDLSQICFWSNHATDIMLIELWSSKATIQFALENSKTSKETTEGKHNWVLLHDSSSQRANN